MRRHEEDQAKTGGGSRGGIPIPSTTGFQKVVESEKLNVRPMRYAL
jgi:hypothetical protein